MKLNRFPVLSALAALGLCALTGVAIAQDAKPGESQPPAAPAAPAAKKPRGGVQGLIKELDLTTEQKAKLKPAMDKMKADGKALRDDATLDRKAKAEKMKELNKAFLSEIEKVLTPEQKVKFDAEKKKMEEAQAKRGKRPGKGK